MHTWDTDVGLTLKVGDQVELRVLDLSLARAFYEGIPAARLLARMRLRSDESDLEAGPLREATASSWDALLARLTKGAPEATEHVKKAIARSTRGAFEEGALAVDEPSVAALVFALAGCDDADASAAEALGVSVGSGRGDRSTPTAAGWSAREVALTAACTALEPRLGAPDADARGVLFEACARLASRAVAGPWPADRVGEALGELAASDLHVSLRRSNAALFPLAFDAEVPAASRRMALLERAELDALVAKDPRELASAIARSERTRRHRPTQSDTLLADLTTLLTRAGDLVILVRGPDVDAAMPVPSIRPSWAPADWASLDAVSMLADAVERGTTTIPRLEGLLSRGGEFAIDAIGAEMLRVASHPFASSKFAELVARSGRPRDVIRLVTYFAIAPDPTDAARALAACASPELPSVLRAWLEAMLPSDGGDVPFGENPETSSAARLTACVSSLAPYPRLYGAVRPLLARVSEAPPQSDGPLA